MNTAQRTLPAFTRAVLRRMAWRHAVPWIARSVGGGLIAATLILLVAHFLPWPAASGWALVAGLAVMGVGVAAAWATRPAQVHAIRAADRILGLRDRLTTAWEYGEMETPILRLQRADLVARIENLNLRAGLSLRPGQRDALAPVLGVVLLLATVALPNAQPRVQGVRVAGAAAARGRLAHAAARIATARRASAVLPPGTLSALPPIDRQRQARAALVMTRLQRALAMAHTQSDALQALAHAQDALNHLSNRNARAQTSSLSALAAALARGAGARDASVRALSRALDSRNPSAISAAMKRLADSVNHMSATERGVLARALQQAAHAASANAALSASLQQAATSLAQNDTRGAQDALRSSARQAASAAAQSAQEAALNALNSAIDTARNDASGFGSEGAAHRAGQPREESRTRAASGTGGGRGTGQRQGAGRGGASGRAPMGRVGSQRHGSARGQGTGSAGGRGTGAGSGRGGAAGRGAGAGNGRGGAAGRGAGGSRGGNGRGGAAGATASQRIYIPAPQGSGPSLTTTGAPGAPSQGSFQPWRAALPVFERSARAALENTSVPAEQRTLVKRYFDLLNQ